MARPPFEEIPFRYVDAENELMFSPEVVREGYVNIANFEREVLHPAICIVHGAKGSGKTGVAMKCKQLAEERKNWFVDVDDLEKFQFSDLRSQNGSKRSMQANSFPVWRMLLAIKMAEILGRDDELHAKNPNLDRILTSLEEVGLVADGTVRQIATQTAQRGSFAKIKSAVLDSGVQGRQARPRQLKSASGLADGVMKVLCGLKSVGGKYIGFFDGLDYVLRYGRSHVEDLRELIAAVIDINRALIQARLDAKFVLLLRREVLSMIPDPNLSKKLNDNGLELSWKGPPSEMMSWPLLEVVSRRANSIGIAGSASNLWPVWFQEDTFFDRSSVSGFSSAGFVLDHTRFMPRDVVKLFACLQDIDSHIPFSRDAVLSALVAYSEWFRTELNDAIVGIVVDEVRLKVPVILQSLGRSFDSHNFAIAMERHGVADRQSPHDVLSALYDTSWIGQEFRNDAGYHRFSFKHRNKSSKFIWERGNSVHRGLWKALNMI